MAGSAMDLERENWPLEVLRGDMDWKEYFEEYGHPSDKQNKSEDKGEPQ